MSGVPHPRRPAFFLARILMTVRREITLIIVPREAYLANKDETCSLPVLRYHPSLDTNDEEWIGESTAVEMEWLWFRRRCRLDFADSQVSFRDIERHTVLDRDVFLN